MSSGKSNRGRVLRNLIILAVIMAAVFAWRFRALNRDEAIASIRSVQESEGVPVETVEARRGAISHWITLAGTVEGVTQYPVVSNNALRVVGIPVREGDAVKSGDVIIRLASEAPSPMYHSLDKSRAGYENTLRDTRRMRNLYAEGAISRQQLDAAETQLAVAAADLQDAEGSTALTASAAGVVTGILVTEGETVDTHEPLAWIADTGRVKLRFEAGSRQALALAVGQKAVWMLPDGAEGGSGEIAQLDLMADSATHLLEGEALFDNDEGRLVPGLLVTFRVRTVHREGVLTVPRGCLVDAADGRAVWVVDADGRAALRPVAVGLENTDAVEIAGGLTAGDSVVLHGQTLIEEGVLVKRVVEGEAS